ncbi:MAG: hypothetical protein GC191_02125 [Azospirillum sp.]|nr:hypothetical protein [Azospirillum sp.]
MILTCPACSVRYTIADSAVSGRGRKVRCSRCGHKWVEPPADAPFDSETDYGSDEATLQALREEMEKQVPPADPFEMSEDVIEDDEPPARSGRLVPLAFTLVAILALALGVVAGRDLVVELWPAAALLYETIGMPVDPPGAGLSFQNARVQRDNDGGVGLLLIDGQIVNTSAIARVVPPIVAMARGPDHRVIHTWTLLAAETNLLPGGITTFRAVERGAGTTALEVAFGFAGG